MAREDVPLLERDRELAVIADLVARARGGAGGLLMLEGAAGIGKTRLISAARETACRSGMAVLSARATELERSLPFGVVRSLYERAVVRAPVGERKRLLTGAAGMSALALGLEGADMALAPDRDGLTGLHGLYWLTANLADFRPLLLTVDDAHWADEASLRFVLYLLHRVQALPVLVILAARRREPEADEALLERLSDDPLTVAVRPAALSQTAAAALVRAGFSPRADARLCSACHTATGGNPLLLRMLSHALRDEDADPSSAGQGRVVELSAHVVACSVLPRLRRLPADAGSLARAVAVLGDGVQLRHAAAVAGLATGPALRAADALATAGILGGGRPLEFAHPLVRRAVYESLPTADRHRAHRHAAELLDADGATPEKLAVHLMVTERLADQWVVEVLRAAARHALARGAVEEAVRCLERAWQEPPPPEVRAEVLLELGTSVAHVNSDTACAYLREALALEADPRRHSHIALELARALSTAWDTRGALAVLERAVRELGEANPPMRVRLEAEYISLARRDPATRQAATRRLELLRAHGKPGSLVGCVILANVAADALEERGATKEATRLACAALAEDHLLVSGESDVALMATVVLTATDHLDPAWRAWNAEIDRARRSGSILRFATAVTVRAFLAYRCGQLADAEADARLADDVHCEHSLELPRRYSLAFLVGALVERGELAAAGELLDASTVPMNLAVLLESRAKLRYEQGSFAESAEDYLASGRRLAGRGTRNPGVLAWRSGAALALHQLHQPDEAQRLADQEVDLARKLGIPRGLGIALRAAGLVRGGAVAVELLEQAVTLLARSSARLEHARALTDLGAALRRDNRRTEAREPLRTGLELAAQCGATPLADRAHQELLAAGARPRRSRAGIDALTPSELRVARMAADGLTNRTIAQALFVTVKTVEVHLSSTYRKLSIPSRAALADLLR